MRQSSTLTQLLRYAIVGGIAFVADYGSLWMLTEHVHLHYLTSAALAFVIGLAVNYSLCKLWVFKKHNYDSRWMEFAIFALIGVVGLALNEAIIYLMAHILAHHYMIGKLTSTIIVFLWNFLARKYILFHE